MMLSFSKLFCAALCFSLAVCRPSELSVRLEERADPPAGLVTVQGLNFVLNGKPWTFAGTNAWWVTNQTSEKLVRQAVYNAWGQGYQVLRVWAFNEWITSDPKPQVYFQSWNGSTPTINDGPDGLQILDYLVKAAYDYGIKLIMVMTNNWNEYGGMQSYIYAAGPARGHSLFYTDPNIVGHYKDYVKTIVQRYSNSTSVLAWELANEARCSGTNPDAVPTNCTADTITKWTDQMSTYIKSIDPTHLVAFGGEGFFNYPDRKTYEYNGGSGQDNDAILNLKNIDFGTVHVYPNMKERNLTWAAQYIIDHVDPAIKANKPLVMEEYGYSSQLSNPSRKDVYNLWHGFEMTSPVYQGDIVWSFACSIFESSSSIHNYSFAIYPSDPDFGDLVTNFTKQMSGKAKTLKL